MSTYTQITYHLVFASKNRTPVFHKNYRRELYVYIHGILKNRNCHTFRINGVEDHLHILISLHPSISLANLIKEIKTGSSAWMKSRKGFEAFEHWQEGYGAFTHNRDERTRLIEYIVKQEEHHVKISFEDELRKLVEEAGLEFDARYLP